MRIFAELVPYLRIKKQAKVIKLLHEINGVPLDINWGELIEFQVKCLSRMMPNGVSIPDLIRFISVNRPRTGASHASDNWNALTFADDLLQVANHLKVDKAIIVGFSAGGLYGCAFAHKYPERVKKLALLASLSPYDIIEKKLNEAGRTFHENTRKNPDALLK